MLLPKAYDIKVSVAIMSVYVPFCHRFNHFGYMGAQMGFERYGA